MAENAQPSFSNQARDRRNPSRPDFSRPQTNPCLICRLLNAREFHWKRDCPRVIQNNRQGSTAPARTASADNDNASSSIAAPTHDGAFQMMTRDFVWFDVTINGHNVRAMLDSGSSITAISRATANRTNLQWDESRSSPLTHVDGMARTLGAIDVDITLDGKTVPCTVHVLERLGPAMLIGIELAAKAKLIVDFAEDTFPQSFALHLNPKPQLNTLSSQFMVLVNTTLTPTQDTVDSLFAKFPNIFAQDRSDFGRIPGFQHEIRLLPDAKPFHKQPFRLSAPKEAIMKKFIDEMLTAGVIRPSRSPFASPAFLVPKGSNDWRPVIDFSTLNTVTVPERSPLPIIRDLIDKLTGSQIFTTLDIAWGYWHIPLAPESVEKTSFVTTFGQFEFLTLPFGLKNSSSVFQRAIRHVLHDFLGKGVEQFIDDSIVHTVTMSEHLQLLERLFH